MSNDECVHCRLPRDAHGILNRCPGRGYSYYLNRHDGALDDDRRRAAERVILTSDSVLMRNLGDR